MAIPDRRLFELVALLGDAGVGWLGLEIIDAVRDGLPAEESPESFHATEEGLGRSIRRPFNVVQGGDLPVELHGAKQLSWAAAYVVERLRDEVEMLDLSLEQLNVLANSRERLAGQSPPHAAFDAAVALQLGEDGPTVNAVDILAFRSDLEHLSRALESWATAPSSDDAL